MVSTAPFGKALAALKRSLDQPKNEFTRNSTIQCFEFSYELAWKLVKRYFEHHLNMQEISLKDLWREAGKQGLVNSVENWFEYHKARNLTSHTYNENTAEEVYWAAQKFYVDAIALLAKMEPLLA